jgi:phenylpropionate dioxygenase-like ring-hydroxylating dioxygenase large terminal subunit
MHGTEFDNVRPTEARPDARTPDARFSVVQLASTGNTPVFRCPYHAWTNDLNGKLISVPHGMRGGFKSADARAAPMSRADGRRIHLGELRAARAARLRRVREQLEDGLRGIRHRAAEGRRRKQYPTKANWKLALENFRECYHCQHAHTRSFTATHALFLPTTTPDRRTRSEQELPIGTGRRPISQRDAGVPCEGRSCQAFHNVAQSFSPASLV